MTGLYIVAIAAVLAVAFGLYRRTVDGRVRPAAARHDLLDAASLGAELGVTATFVQFSSAVCAPCRVTSRLLAELTATEPGLEHVELDAERQLDLVERFGITRTPTVLLLDGAGVVRSRIVGAPRKPDVIAALDELGAGRRDRSLGTPDLTRRG